MKRMILAVTLGLALSCSWAAALPEPVIMTLSPADQQFMQSQRERIDNLARTRLGRQLNGSRENDLGILQILLDRKLVTQTQTLELQAMGVVLGDLLARDPSVEWVIYRDPKGRSRALRMGNSDEYLFPITMISRRAETGARVDVHAIFAKADRLIQPHRRPLPFQ